MTCQSEWYKLSRIIMEEKLGRSLLPNEAVHHKDGDITNVEDDNLELFETISKHSSFHNLGNTKHLGHTHTQETKDRISRKCSQRPTRVFTKEDKEKVTKGLLEYYSNKRERKRLEDEEKRLRCNNTIST